MSMIVITCARCGGASQVDEAHLGQMVRCPRCGEATPAAAPASAPVSSPISSSTPAPGESPGGAAPSSAAPSPAPPPSLTRSERQALRRRRHVIVAVLCAAGLALAAAVLLRIG
ncbi:MAG: hypothetical protein KF688_07805 [Pirellulales bacterium]|nr:hypothetical protein [Pirellulales bacterium]